MKSDNDNDGGTWIGGSRSWIYYVVGGRSEERRQKPNDATEELCPRFEVESFEFSSSFSLCFTVDGTRDLVFREC